VVGGVGSTERDADGFASQNSATITDTVLKVQIDGETIEVKDQIQLIAPNEILDNPLVSLVTQASLGGLCPLLIVPPCRTNKSKSHRT
jgi:hypothetical protein